MIGKRSLSAVLATMAISAPGFAEEFRFTTGAPNGTPWVTHYEQSAANLSENSGGTLIMEVFGGGQLGAETETIRQVARGRLDAGNFSVTAAASVVPEVTLLVSPFFWDSVEQADCALDNHLLPIFDELFEARGLRIIQWTELGYQILFSEEPITDVSQVQGFSMRVAPARNSDILWRGLGAAGVPLPFPEVAPNLQTGIIDGGELPTISYIATGLHNLAPHMTRTNHIYQPSVTLMNLSSWNGMSEEEQEIFTNSIEPAEALRTAVRGAISYFEGVMLQEGGTIHDLTDEERAAWAAGYTEEMQQDFVASIGGDADRVYQEVLLARAACSG